MPTLDTARNILDIGVPLAQGIVNSRATSGAVNNLTNGTAAATTTITDAANKAQETLDATHANSKSLLQPYQSAGAESLTTLQNGLKPDGGMADPFKYLPPELSNDPIFQRRLKEGLDIIQAKGNAGGNRFSTDAMAKFSDYATGSANDYLDSDYKRQENTFRQNEADSFNRNLALEQQGQGAATQGVNENTNYGASTVGLTTSTGKSVAELNQEKAQALAAGNIEQANAIDGILSGLSTAVSNKQDATLLQKLLHPGDATAQAGNLTNASKIVAPTATSVIGGSAGTAAGAGTSLAAIQAGAVPEISSSAIGLGSLPTAVGGTGGAAAATAATPLTSYAGGGLITGHGALVGMMTNPITIGVGAALAGLYLLHKSQVHPQANEFVQKYQKPFGDHLGAAVNGFDSAFASGKLDKQTAQQIRDEVAGQIAQFQKTTDDFAKQGSHQAIVAKQAKETMAANFGPNWERLIGKMDSEIAQLPEAA